MFKELSDKPPLHKHDSSSTLCDDSTDDGSEQQEKSSSRKSTQHKQKHNFLTHSVETIKLRDKVSFAIGVANTCITPLIVSRAPEWIPLYYTLQLIYFITFRVVEYRAKRWQYFFFDLCYFDNALLLGFLWLLPHSTVLFSVVFVLTNGPVLWAIVTWRNSLVFHSLDKITSVFIHIFPALVTFVLRWLPELHINQNAATTYLSNNFPGVSNLPTMGWWYTLVVSIVSYVVWQLLYIVFVMGKEKIKSGARIASYSLLLKASDNKKSKKKPFILNLVSLCGEDYKLHMFVFWQFWYTLGTCALTYFYYKSFWLHSASLVIMFAVSVWNGATYYIDIFSKCYQNEIRVVDKYQ